MAASRIELVGLGALILTATAAASLAQNTGASMLGGNTVNPVLSGNTTLLPARSELTVSPTIPTGLLSNTTGTNPLTGLPFSEVKVCRGARPGTNLASMIIPVGRHFAPDLG